MDRREFVKSMITAAVVGPAVIKSIPAHVIPSVTFEIPTGTVLPFTGSTIPHGWLLCNGLPIDKEKYSELFKALKRDTLPDLRGFVDLSFKRTISSEKEIHYLIKA